MLAFVALFALVGTSLAQNTCECGIDGTDFFGSTFLNLELFPTTTLADCGDRGRIRCEAACAAQGDAWLQALDLDAPGADGKVKGQELCDKVRADPEYVGGAIDLEYFDVFNRVCGNDWEFMFSDETGTTKLCCDQVGNYIANCP